MLVGSKSDPLWGPNHPQVVNMPEEGKPGVFDQWADMYKS